MAYAVGRLRLSAITIAAALLGACGGGGGGEGGGGSTPAYTVGGTISGLTLSGNAVLQDNLGDDLPLSANGPFTFATPVAQGGLYSVTVLSAQRPFQSCSVSAGSGTIAGANVTDVAVDCAVPHNLVFFTSTTVTNGNLGASPSAALAAADVICNARAMAGGLPGSYVAWLSTSTVNAKDRLGTSRGWVRTDGLPFIDTVADLVASKILYPPRLDENGAVAGPTVRVFTGTGANGNVVGNTCSNWASASNVVFGAAGLADAGGSTWTSVGSPSCDTPAHLYCFGTGSTAPLAFAPATGRLAFLSAGFFIPQAGSVAAADALCQSEAAAAGQAGTFKALLATTTASAASRFSTTGATWVRRDGVRAFASASDLAATKLLAPIAVRADGTYFSGNAWIGASDFATAGTSDDTCANWTSTLPFGRAENSDLSAFVAGPGSTACTGGPRLFCLQQ